MDMHEELSAWHVEIDADGRERTVFADGSYCYGWSPRSAPAA